jgi:polyvinyl alcohol dehydrogenase (cytochrome)
VAALALAVAPPARAAEQHAYAAGLTYATPAVAAGSGETLRFTNLDPLAQHDLDSDTPGLFGSPVVGTNQSTLVAGVDRLAPGTYTFHCSLHAWMRGALTVTAAKAPSVPSVPDPPSGPGEAPNPVDLLPKVPAAPLGPGEWPLYGHDLANTRNGGTDSPSYNEVPTLGPVWSFRSDEGDFTGTPVVADGTLVAAAGGGSVIALDASTGAHRWTTDLNEPINGSAAIADGRVYVPLATPNAPKVAALSLADGKRLWTATVDTQEGADVFGSPTVYGGTVYIGTSGQNGDPQLPLRGVVVALDAASGAQRWKTYTVPPGFNGGPVWSTPAIDARTGRLYVGTGNAYTPPAAPTTDAVLALDAASGAILGSFQATGGDAFSGSNAAGGPDYDFGASPNLFYGPGGRALVGEGQKSGTYWALDRGTLKPAWSALTGAGSAVGGIVGSTAVDARGVYGPNTPGGVQWALHFTGKPAWFSADGGPLHFSSTSAGNGVVYTADMTGVVTARDDITGAVLAKLPLGSPSWGGVALAGGYVFAVTGTGGDSGYVVAYRPRG